jgi:hypothetical protein
MARHHMTAEGPIPFTPEEEAEWDAQEAAWAADAGNRVRLDRTRLLAETDWSQAVDVPQAIKDKWAPYRQALRDVPQQPGFPENITWPTKPE